MDNKRLYEEAMRGDEEAKKKLFKQLQREGFGGRLVLRPAVRGSGVLAFTEEGDFASAFQPQRPSKKTIGKIKRIEEEKGEILRVVRNNGVFHVLYKFPGGRYGKFHLSSTGKECRPEYYWACMARKIKQHPISFKYFPGCLVSERELMSLHPRRWSKPCLEIFILDPEVFPKERWRPFLDFNQIETVKHLRRVLEREEKNQSL